MWKDIIFWIQHDGVQIVLILAVAAIVAHFGVQLLSSIVRRTVGRIKTDISEDDIKKAPRHHYKPFWHNASCARVGNGGL